MTTIIDLDLEQPVAQQDKDAHTTYSFDMKSMIPAGDTLAGVVWTPPTGITIDASSFTASSCTVKLSGGTPLLWYPVVCSYTTQGGEQNQFVLRLFIKADPESVAGLGTALFPNRFTAVAALRRDRLALAANSILPQVQVSDDYLWDKLRAAEASVQHTLRVDFQTTQYFPLAPSQADINALPPGMPWKIDPGYDFEPDFFHSDRWGFMSLRHKPVSSVSLVRIYFPNSAAATFYTVPTDWLRLESKYGLLQFVPTSGIGGSPLNAFMLQVLGMGRNVPFAIQATYRAGLENAAQDYPDLIDVVQKKAVLRVIEDKFLPQSGSISADGLSQSLSIDMEKYRDTVDTILNGPKGSNGGLMAAIHGVRTLVM